jgi:hypothetical protein
MADLLTIILRCLRKIKLMLPSMEIQNGAQTQDGRQNVFNRLRLDFDPRF